MSNTHGFRRSLFQSLRDMRSSPDLRGLAGSLELFTDRLMLMVTFRDLPYRIRQRFFDLAKQVHQVRLSELNSGVEPKVSRPVFMHFASLVRSLCRVRTHSDFIRVTNQIDADLRSKSIPGAFRSKYCRLCRRICDYVEFKYLSADHGTPFVPPAYAQAPGASSDVSLPCVSVQPGVEACASCLGCSWDADIASAWAGVSTCWAARTGECPVACCTGKVCLLALPASKTHLGTVRGIENLGSI